MTNPQNSTAPKGKMRVPRKPRTLKAVAFDKSGNVVAQFFDRGPMKALVDPLPIPLFLATPVHPKLNA